MTHESVNIEFYSHMSDCARGVSVTVPNHFFYIVKISFISKWTKIKNKNYLQDTL